MYKVSITRPAEKDLKRLDRSTKNRIIEVILSMADQPRPPGCRKILSEEGVWRVRMGDWRIGYEIDDAHKEITVIRIGHRREFYS